jgi:hypothetical protein
MSTKSSIKRKEHTSDSAGFHLYDEVLDFEDDPPIYLRLDGVQVELATLGDGGASVTLALPRAIARELGLLPQQSALTALRLSDGAEAGGERRPPAQIEIAERLRTLADDMDDIAVVMDYYGGFAEWSQHGREIAGAGAIARQWADEIEAANATVQAAGGALSARSPGTQG